MKSPSSLVLASAVVVIGLISASTNSDEQHPLETVSNARKGRNSHSITTLALEITELNREIRNLRQENAQLRTQNERQPVVSDKRTGRINAKQELTQNRADSEKIPRVATDAFIDHGDYIEDTRTGLLWQKDGAASEKLNFYQAYEYAVRLQLGGISGWRLPNKSELATIFPANELPFTNSCYTSDEFVEGGSHEGRAYWTSNVDASLPDYAFVYQWYADGGGNNCYAGSNYEHVRCVHDPVKLP